MEQSLKFSGTGYLDLGTSSKFDLTTAGTIEVWFKVNGGQSNGTSLIAKANISASGTAPSRTYIQTIDSTTILTTRWNNGYTQVTYTFPSNTWIHLATTWGDGYKTNYINGVQVERVAFTSVLAVNSGVSLKLGMNAYYGATNALNGNLDEIRLWNVCRTASQVQTNYNKYINSGTGLVVYLNFSEETSITSLKNQADGTIITATVIGSGISLVSDSSIASETKKHLIQDLDTLTLYRYDGTNIVKLADNTIAESNFLTYGYVDLSVISESTWKTFTSLVPHAQILTYTSNNTRTSCNLVYNTDSYIPMNLLDNSAFILKYGLTNDLIENLPNYEIYYAININSAYYIYTSGIWKKTLYEDIYYNGMKSSDLNVLTSTIYNLLGVSKTDSISVVGITKVNSTGAILSIANIQVTFSDYYETGVAYITTNLNSFNTIDWASITNILITQTLPVNTNIRYAFSNDLRNNWVVYKNDTWVSTNYSDIYINGMTKDEIEALTSDRCTEFLNDTLDVAIVLISNNYNETPSIDQFTINYTQLPTPLVSTSISIPVPDKGYKNVLTDNVNIIYTLCAADGIAFDDTTVDYNFYTTSDKIHLRPLDMGVMIGGRQQNIFAVEIINAYNDKNFLITLRGTTQDGVVAEEKVNYGLLYDSNDTLGRTKFELSTNANNFNTVTYPLQFNLNAGQRQNVYIRITPTIYNTIGTKQLQLKLTGKPI